METPAILKDARFRGGRKLVTIGKADKAVDIFGNLLEQVRTAHGADSIECAGPYYEYGNALFRIFLRRDADQKEPQPEPQPEQEGDHPRGGNSANEEVMASKRSAAAEAAEKRLLALSGQKDVATLDKDMMNKKPAVAKIKSTGDDDDGGGDKKQDSKNENIDNDDNDDDDDSDNQEEEDGDPDLLLALEMMETAWSILDQYLTTTTTSPLTYKEWAKDQFPRYLTGIGEVLSEMGRHADAADVYSRAAQDRQLQWQAMTTTTTTTTTTGTDDKNENTPPPTLEQLVCRRRIAEAYILVAEEFLACPADEDVVTSETKSLLCKAAERVEYARGYYDKARDELQETVLLMGRLVAANPTLDIEEEKQNVCFASTLVMAVGKTLAELDEHQQLQHQQTANAKEPVKKKSKLA